MAVEAYRTGVRWRGLTSRAWGIALALALVVLAVAPFRGLLPCLAGCNVALDALPPGLGASEIADTRLNTWILGWVQHAVLTRPFDLFQANALYPAPNVLAGSEHLIGLAVPLL